MIESREIFLVYRISRCRMQHGRGVETTHAVFYKTRASNNDVPMSCTGIHVHAVDRTNISGFHDHTEFLARLLLSGAEFNVWVIIDSKEHSSRNLHHKTKQSRITIFNAYSVW